MDAAYITTFDSFSLGVVKKYHDVINKPKDIKITDPILIDIKKRELLDKIFDTNYGGEDGGDTPITPTLDSISVKTAPNKLTYTEGEKFDPTGLVITRNYSDGNEDTLSYSGNTSLFTFSPSCLTTVP